MAIVRARPVNDKTPNDVEARLRAALIEAIGTRDVVAAFALRSALSAIGNAGAVPAGSTQVPDANSPHVAGSLAGPGAAEVPRRHLTPADISEIVRPKPPSGSAPPASASGPGTPTGPNGSGARPASCSRSSARRGDRHCGPNAHV